MHTPRNRLRSTLLFVGLAACGSEAPGSQHLAGAREKATATIEAGGPPVSFEIELPRGYQRFFHDGDTAAMKDEVAYFRKPGPRPRRESR